MQVRRARLAVVLALAAAALGGLAWVRRPLPIGPPPPPLGPPGAAEYTRLDPDPADLDQLARPGWLVTEYRGRPCVLTDDRLTRTAADRLEWRSVTASAVAYRGDTHAERVEDRLTFEPRPPFRLLRATRADTHGPDLELAPVPDGGWRLTASRGELTHVREVGAVEYALADFTTIARWVRQPGRRAGDRLVVRDLDLSAGRVAPAAYRVTRVTPDPAGGPPTVEYELVRADGRRAAGATRGDRLLWERCGPWATREVDARPDPARWTPPPVADHIPTDAGPEDTRRVTGLRLRLTGPAAGTIRDGPGQRVRADGAGVFVETDSSRFPVRATPADEADGLEDTFDFPHRLPAVRALLAEAVPAGARTRRETVEALVEYVHRFVAYDASADPPSVAELLRERRGACGHSAALFVTLARAAGLPARTADGLAWDGGGFGPHRWAEVVLDDGCWHPVDPTWGQTHAAGHLRTHGAGESGEALDRLDELGLSVVSWEEEAPGRRALPWLVAAVALAAGLRWSVRLPEVGEPAAARLPGPPPGEGGWPAGAGG